MADLIEKGDFTGVKEAMENSMAEGSQTFEADLARLINEGRIDRTATGWAPVTATFR